MDQSVNTWEKLCNRPTVSMGYQTPTNHLHLRTAVPSTSFARSPEDEDHHKPGCIWEQILASLSIESWLFNRDPYVMANYNPYITGQYNPLYAIPRCSMYGIFAYICLKFMVNVSKYSIHGASGINNQGALFSWLIWQNWQNQYHQVLRQCSVCKSLVSASNTCTHSFRTMLYTPWN